MRLHAKPDAVFDLSIRSFHPPTDLDMIHEWVNAHYARRFWQMNGAKEGLNNTYLNILQNPGAHSFIITLDSRQVALIDLYLVELDELHAHIETQAYDSGMHLLMCPPHQMKKGLSRAVLEFFIRYYFSFKQSERLYGEPDVNNDKANTLVGKLGFEFLKKITLSYKEANLYVLTREKYASL